MEAQNLFFASSEAHEHNMVQGEALLEGRKPAPRAKRCSAERSLHVAISLSLMARPDVEGNIVHEFHYVPLFIL